MPKVKSTILFMLLLSAMVGQNHKITENYKAAVRIKLHLDDNPLLYMDEPKSAYLNTAHKECRGLIIYYETRQFYGFQSKMNALDRAATRYKQTRYNQVSPKQKESNIRYNYFSTGSSGRD